MRIKGYSTLKKRELEAKVQEIKEKERAETYERELRDTALCSTCLEKQRIQRKIDSKTFTISGYSRALVRTLVCEYCKHANLARDGDRYCLRILWSPAEP